MRVSVLLAKNRCSTKQARFTCFYGTSLYKAAASGATRAPIIAPICGSLIVLFSKRVPQWTPEYVASGLSFSRSRIFTRQSLISYFFYTVSIYSPEIVA